MTTTSIEWTEQTWNPVRGCSIVSPGCINCYAMKQAHRFGGPGKLYHGLTKPTAQGPQWTGTVVCDEAKLLEPLSWRKPQLVFVNSMSDLFHEDVPDAFIDRVFASMAFAMRHTFQVLTKRADRMRAYLIDEGRADRIADVLGFTYPQPKSAQIARAILGAQFDIAPGVMWPLANVWVGVSAENQEQADKRIPLLLQTPAAVRWVSAEPLLGPIDFSAVSFANYVKPGHTMHGAAGLKLPTLKGVGGSPPIPGLDWIVIGGESGPGARPMQLEWAESILTQCRRARVPVFMKQLGSAWRGISFRVSEGVNQRITDRKGGDPTEWPEDLRVREWPVGVGRTPGLRGGSR